MWLLTSINIMKETKTILLKCLYMVVRAFILNQYWEFEGRFHFTHADLLLSVDRETGWTMNLEQLERHRSTEPGVSDNRCECSLSYEIRRKMGAISKGKRPSNRQNVGITEGNPPSIAFILNLCNLTLAIGPGWNEQKWWKIGMKYKNVE